jgi:uncharacterized protein YciI
VAAYFLVKHVPGPRWDHSRRRREQVGWDEHAAFMDSLTEEGLIVLGGPVGTGDGDYALLVVDAPDEETIRARLAEDPWADGTLAVQSIEPWSVWLRADAKDGMA